MIITPRRTPMIKVVTESTDVIVVRSRPFAILTDTTVGLPSINNFGRALLWATGSSNQVLVRAGPLPVDFRFKLSIRI